MDPLYTVELFGGLRVVAHFDMVGESSVRALTRFRTHQTGSLLAYLASNAGRVLSREVIIDMLWPDACGKSGRSRLSMALSSLRSQIEPPGIVPGSVLITDQHRIGLSRLVTTDTARFEALIDAAERVNASPQERKSNFEKAVKLFNREIAPGHYDNWIVAEQERLADRATKAFLYLARAAEANGEIAAAQSYAKRAASDGEGLCDEAEDMLDRLSAGTRSNSNARGMNRAAPLRMPANAFDTDSSVGVAPPPAVRRQESRDQSAPPPVSEPAAAQPVLPVPLTRFFGRAAELRALESAVADPRIRLITLTGVGGSGKTRLVREAALQWRSASAMRLTEDDAEFSRLPDARDIISLDLTTETDPFRIPIRIAAALDIPAADVDAYEDTRESNALRPFVEAFAARRAPVLILDNMEQLLPYGADWLEALLVRAPHLTCVVTSRVRLRTPGEHEIAVLPLASPPAARSARRGILSDDAIGASPLPESVESFRLEKLLTDWPSVALFVDRAQAARPGFALTQKNVDDVVALVRHLEGLPLSIELAAARAQVMTPAHMLRQLLDNRFELLTSRGSGSTGRRRRAGRHTSLRETVAWSVSLLPDDVQTFYGQMSVFRGGWDDEAAEAVSDNPMALDALAVLCDASLVRADATVVNDDEVFRFDMLESLREYASTVLNEDLDDAEAEAELIDEAAKGAPPHPAYVAAATRHFEFFAGVVAQSAPHLQGPDGKFYFADLSRDNENIKTALMWSTAQNSCEIAQKALTLGGDLGPYWTRTGRLQEGRDLLKATLARSVRTTYRSLPPASVAPKLVKAVNSLGVLAMQQRDFKDARYWFRAALFLERNGDHTYPAAAADKAPRTQYLRRRASILNNFAIVKGKLYDLHGAARAYKDSLSLWRELGDVRFVGTVLSNMGTISAKCKDIESAERYYRESIPILRAASCPHAEAVTLNNLAELSVGLGKLTEADALYRQSLRIFHAQTDIASSAQIVFHLGLIQVQNEDTVGHGSRMLRIGSMVLSEDGIALCEADKAAALKFVGDSWLRPTQEFGDPRTALEALVNSLLVENHFASASGTRNQPVSDLQGANRG